MSTKKMDDLKLFFEVLEAERTKRNWSYVKIAEISGLNAKYLSLLKNGRRNAKAETLEKISLTFGYQLVDFLALGRTLAGGANLAEAKPTRVDHEDKDAVIAALREALTAKDQVIAMQNEMLKQLKARVAESRTEEGASALAVAEIAPDVGMLEK